MWTDRSDSFDSGATHQHIQIPSCVFFDHAYIHAGPRVNLKHDQVPLPVCSPRQSNSLGNVPHAGMEEFIHTRIKPIQQTHQRSLRVELTDPKAPCSFIVATWASKGLPYHDFGAYVDTIKLHAAFGRTARVSASGTSVLT